jgi:hypothetical protein
VTYNATGFVSQGTGSDFRGIWTFPTLEKGQFRLRLNGTAAGRVQDIVGNDLNGVWTNPECLADITGNDQFPSGTENATSGTDFQFHFTLLPGDRNQDGTVGAADLPTGTEPPEIDTWPEGDLNGDSDFTNDDVLEVMQNYGVDFRPWPGSSCGGGKWRR